MATSKHASIRYGVLDKCLQKKDENNTQANLRALCCDAIAYKDPKYESAEISLRTFRADIKYLKEFAEEHDVKLETKLGSKGYYYYYSDSDFSIYKNQLSDSEVGQLKCAMQLLSRFRGLPEYDGIADIGAKLEEKYGIVSRGETYVEYEHVESIGEEMMADICNFIIKQQPLRISYMPYGKEEREWIIHPYLLKEYNNRWFLFGYNENEQRISNVPLDRIRADYELVPNTFIPNTFVDFETYFSDVVGVTVKGDTPTEITLKASENRFPYIESKPIHGSQELKDLGQRLFSIRVKPNRELDSLILSFGGDLEILSPEWYRDRIKRMVAEMNKIYFGGQDGCTPRPYLCSDKDIHL